MSHVQLDDMSFPPHVNWPKRSSFTDSLLWTFFDLHCERTAPPDREACPSALAAGAGKAGAGGQRAGVGGGSGRGETSAAMATPPPPEAPSRGRRERPLPRSQPLDREKEVILPSKGKVIGVQHKNMEWTF